MSIAVFAGAAQFIAVDLWANPVPFAEIVTATLIINLRYFLIGFSLRPIFLDQPIWIKLLGIHLVSDENWALTMSEKRRGEATPGYLFGSGLSILLFWLSGCVLGYMVSGSLPRPETLGLDFAFTAAFISLAVGLWQGNRDIKPWTIAALCSVLSSYAIPGQWYIIIGAISGTVVSLFVQEKNGADP